MEECTNHALIMQSKTIPKTVKADYKLWRRARITVVMLNFHLYCSGLDLLMREGLRMPYARCPMPDKDNDKDKAA